MLKRISLYLVLVSVVFASTGECQPLSVDSLFEKGNRAYQKEDYKQAIEYYSQIVDSGIENHKIYYNLANAYFREQKVGKAIANYSRALKLAPRDEDALANLRYVKLFAVDKMTDRYPSFLARGVDSFVNFWSINELNMVFALSCLLLAVLLILGVFFKAKGRFLNLIVLIFLVVFVISGAGFGLKLHELSLKRGVIVEDEVDIRSGPGEEWTSQLVVHQGLELAIKAKADGWYQVGLPNQVIGWVPENSVEKI